MRVVDAEDRHTVVDPQFDDVAHGLVDALGIVVEVQGVDVLVLLRRVLRIGDGAVGAGREPLRMFLHPRVVGGALEGQVESDLQAEASGALDEAVEVGEVAELGVDGVVAALGGADAVGRTRITGSGLQGVVLALAVRCADRVDRGQVDDVEAHAGNARQFVGGARERAGDPRAVRALEGTRGAREDLVPRARQGLRAGHVERVDAGGVQQVTQWVVAEDQAHARRDARGEALLGGMAGVAQAACRVGQDVDVRGRGTLLGGVAVGGAFGRALHEEGALFEHELDVDAGADLYRRVVAPGGVGVGPGVHAEGPRAGGVGGDPGLVPVEAGGDVHHARAGVFTSVWAQQDGLGGECVVSFAEHGRTNGERLAFGRLGGKRAVFDDGEHFDDRDTGQQFLAHETHPSLWMRARESQAQALALRPMSI